MTHYLFEPVSVAENLQERALNMSYIDYVTSGVKFIVGLLAIALGTLYVYQDNMLYYPNPPGLPKTVDENPQGFNSPQQWNKDGSSNLQSKVGSDPIPFEDTFVTTDDGAKVHLWLMLHDNSANVPTLIYFHGNAGNMGFRLKNAAMMYAACGINVLMVDYRGYGSSTGSPSEKGLNLDAEAVLNFAKSHPKLKNSLMVPFGRSLGGAVALQLARARPNDIAGVILENTFLSISARAVLTAESEHRIPIDRSVVDGVRANRDASFPARVR